MLAFTHATLALVLGYILELPLILFIFGALFPDLDAILTFPFPLLQGGILHTPLAAIVLTILIYLISARKYSALSFLGGYLSNLFLDTLTNQGVMWLFPLTTKFSLNLFKINSLVGNLVISGVSFVFLILWIYQEKVILWVSNLKK